MIDCWLFNVQQRLFDAYSGQELLQTCTIHVHKNYAEMRDNGIKTSDNHCKVLRVGNRWKKIIQK